MNKKLKDLLIAGTIVLSAGTVAGLVSCQASKQIFDNKGFITAEIDDSKILFEVSKFIIPEGTTDVYFTTKFDGKSLMAEKWTHSISKPNEETYQYEYGVDEIPVALNYIEDIETLIM